MGSLLVSRRQRSEALPYLQKAVMLAPEAPWAEALWRQVEDILQRGQVVFPQCLRSPVEWATWRDLDRGLVLPYPAKARLAPVDSAPTHLVDVTDGGMQTFHIVLSQSQAIDDDPKGPLRRLVRQMEGTPQRRVESKTPVSKDGLPGYVFECKNDSKELVELVSFVVRGSDLFELHLECPQGVWLQGRNALVSMFSEWQVWSVPTCHAQRLKAYESQVRANPADLDLRVRLVEVLVDAGQLDAAEQSLQPVLKAQPGYAAALLQQGRLLLGQNRPDQALKALDKALALQPDRRAWQESGQAWERKGQPEKAWRAFQRAAELAPGADEPRLLVARAAEAARHPEVAIAQYEAVLKSSRDPWGIHMLLGALYRRQKQPQEAMTCARTAISLDPNGVSGHLLLGLACLDLQYFDQAEKAFNKILTLDLNCQAARTALADLQARRKSARRY
jgi:tetratricopeptide (TPR) repeat protein